ncbi:MAG: hypothetical protein Q4E21_08935 [Clostridia bacterium]|nr:hypothetical protein [Clostridia bacterium]
MLKRILPLVLLLVLLLSGCGAKTADDATQTSAAPETTTQSNETTLPAATAATTQEKTTAPPAKESPAPETTAAFTMPEKTGDMVFTDDADNKFIKAVVQKYGSDPARLACIYVVPEGDSNHVFEFNGKTDQNGKLIRNESTLKYVYTLNADCSEITRAGGATGNDGLNAAQGLVVMQLTKKLILPEFEEELNG